MTPEPSFVIAGKYRLVRPLASGGMGAIWIGHHIDLDVEVAIKLMGEDVAKSELGRQRFRREARAAAKLKSPHVTQIHDYGVHEGTPYIIMELLDGEDLETYLERKGRLSLARCAEIIEPICHGLTLAHDAGIVHRDLKPSNLFLSKSGSQEVVKILDFGIAKQTAPEAQIEGTASGVLVGSPRYMSPEQAQGMPIDHRSDIWSLGVVLYEMLGDAAPFDGNNLGQLITAICMKERPLLTTLAPDLPAEVDTFFERVLARDPELRLDSASAFAGAVKALAAGEPLSFEARRDARDSSPPPRSAKPREGETIASDDAIALAQTEESRLERRSDQTSPGVGIEGAKKPARSYVVWAGLGLAVVAVGAIASTIGGGRSRSLDTPPEPLSTVERDPGAPPAPTVSHAPSVASESRPPVAQPSAAPSASSGPTSQPAPPPRGTVIVPRKPSPQPDDVFGIPE